MKSPIDKKSCRNPLVGDKREKELEKNAVCSNRLGGHDKYVIESVASDCRPRRDSALPLDVRHIPKIELKENYADGAGIVRGTGYALHETPSHAILSANQEHYLRRFSNAVRCRELHRPDRHSHRTVASLRFKSRFLMPGNNSPWDTHALLEYVRSGKAQLDMP